MSYHVNYVQKKSITAFTLKILLFFTHFCWVAKYVMKTIVHGFWWMFYCVESIQWVCLYEMSAEYFGSQEVRESTKFYEGTLSGYFDTDVPNIFMKLCIITAFLFRYRCCTSQGAFQKTVQKPRQPFW